MQILLLVFCDCVNHVKQCGMILCDVGDADSEVSYWFVFPNVLGNPWNVCIVLLFTLIKSKYLIGCPYCVDVTLNTTSQND